RGTTEQLHWSGKKKKRAAPRTVLCSKVATFPLDGGKKAYRQRKSSRGNRLAPEPLPQPLRLASRPVTHPRLEGWTCSLLQLPFQQLDLFGQRGVGVHEIFDLSHGVQHRGVVTT